MNLVYLEVIIVAAVICGEHCICGSRIFNNEDDSKVQNKTNETNFVKPEENIEPSAQQNSLVSHVSSSSFPTVQDADHGNTITNLHAVNTEEEQRLHNAINTFAQRLSFNIFHIAPKDSPPDTNKTQELPILPTLVWSPLSVYHALLPLYYAADGVTKDELRHILLPRLQTTIKHNSTSNDDETNLLTNLNISDLSGEKGLSSVTGLFTNTETSLNPLYVQQVQEELKIADVKMTDFRHPADATKNINMWVNDSTQGLINEAIDETQLNPDIFMLIVNCVRFKAAWQTRFNEKLTKVSNFNGARGVQRVQMMKQIGTQKFAKFPVTFSPDYHEETSPKTNEGVPFSVLEMPYANDDFVSLFFLPETTEKLQETMEYIDKVGVAEIRQSLHYVDVEVLMPKFKVKSDVNVEEALIQNGLTTLFNPLKANLTKVLEARVNNDQNSTNKVNRLGKYMSPPYLDSIIHRTIFETTEEGTTAAALTALSIVPLSALSNDRVYRFNLNRPFIVLLVKNDNTVIFQGMISDLNGQDLNVPEPTGKNTISEKEANSIRNRNSLLYPTENDVKVELNKLITSDGGENEEVLSRPLMHVPVKKEFSQSSAENQLPELSESGSSEDRAWWIPKRIPAYLTQNNATTLNSTTVTEVPIKVINTETISTVDQAKHTVLPLPSPEKDTYQLIQLSKYQQPEPRDPNGIRFPATIPLSRNKGHIKPRFENYDLVKHHLIRWMNVY